jgi:hypothetical protein
MPTPEIKRIANEQNSDGTWLDRFQEFWCRFQHDALMWPIHGVYECRVCHRRYGVAWESRAAVMPKSRARLIEMTIPAASQATPLQSFPKLVS